MFVPTILLFKGNMPQLHRSYTMQILLNEPPLGKLWLAVPISLIKPFRKQSTFLYTSEEIMAGGKKVFGAVITVAGLEKEMIFKR